MTDRYAVIGNPISHSKSPQIHMVFAQQTDQDIQYEALLAPLDGFQSTVNVFRQQGGSGMNITVPFKQEACQLATGLTKRARIAGAVNTFKFDNDRILGDNTDGAGLVRDIAVNLNISVTDKRILLMGAGGAARGVILPLLQQQPAGLVIANRTPHKAQLLRQQFAEFGPVNARDYMELSGECFDIIINATSASLSDALPELPSGMFTRSTLAYDMMYSTEPTRFLNYAAQQGAQQLADGTGMLVEQAAESFYLWRGIRPETQNIIANLKKPEA
ncbi:shikimate dehydrogenase [Nitrosomonas sp. Nm51]|uniref:shikimate dehydrogenase n=1 Tax=Nitrosomonas sp. Nm51 TaxID=133720 RepID=UPI0008D83814|nr:shikimate dehydrogenase [Nitrosomonas sp. Nm51]SER68741.1 shikimate dehydrogenase [Nitrosomonas sp. Nm51]